MNYYKARIQYVGTGYYGFQWQKDIPTIQEEINQALYKILSGKVTTMGAARTDAGVHALDQIVKISAEMGIEPEFLRIKLNEFLPLKIRCLSLFRCDGSFKPASDSVSKEYRYLFTNTLNSDCLEQLYIANQPYKLDIDLMKNCAHKISGEHDFHNFCSTGSNVKSTIRNISFCELTEVNPHELLSETKLFSISAELTQCYQLRIVGEGFLKQMVRHLMASLWLVGRKRITPEEFSEFLNTPKQAGQIWKVAASKGLYLYKIHY